MRMHAKQELILSLKTMFLMLSILSTLCRCQTTLGIKEAAESKPAFENPGFISIDCGATADYYDNELSMSFKSDKEFIDTGVNANISDEFTKDFNVQGKNLRSFPKGRRNCYTLNPSRVRAKKYLIRAFFFYGNYDDKNKPPIFDLYLANDKWTTVDTKNSTLYAYYEIVYVPSSDYVDVCLSNTASGIPFISALELRPLEDNIYGTKDGWLFLKYRLHVDSSAYIRYPDDLLDRIWNSGQEFISNSWKLWNATFVNNEVKYNNYTLPLKISSIAATSQNVTTSLDLTFPLSSGQYAFYLHFAETQTIQDGLLRKLNVYLNNTYFGKVEFRYLDSATLFSTKPIDVTEGQSNFSIKTADNSSFSPFINAIEVFEILIIKGLSSASDDVNAIKGIKKRYNLKMDSWQGDPCTPSEFKWKGLNCSYNDTIRVVSINLKWSNLKGEIDPLFGSLSALETLDLSHNELTGLIPDSLANLPMLASLNLTGNKLTGPVPKALVDKFRRGLLQLSLDENLSDCQSKVCPITATEEKNKTKSFVVPVVASTVSALVLFLFISLAMFLRTKRRKQKVPSAISIRKPLSPNQLSYSEVENITENFSHEIGEGGFGKVFHGKLDNGQEVAIKMLSPESKQGYIEFRAEAKLLSTLNHKNLVSLIGYCDEQEHKGLIYEYMPKGNLQQCLSGPDSLTWTERLKIAIDCAQGVEYLHKFCTQSIIHRDLKTSNILLDKNLNAKVADFGLSKLFGNNIGTTLSTRSGGTLGYLDPESQNTGNFTDKSDVFSFGVILLELITGCSAIIKGPPNKHIAQWIQPMVEKGDIIKIMDKRFGEKFDPMSARKAIELAMSCVQPTAAERPGISSVLADLIECLNTDMMARKRSSMDLDHNRSGPVEIKSPST